MGELLFRGRGMSKGYYGKPDVTAAAFHGEWFRSGDLARMDARGYVYIVGREKDMICRAGENIAANEIEAVVAALDGIAEVAACRFPTTCAVRSEDLCRPAGRACRERAKPGGHHRALRQESASFKVPRYIEYRDAPLPRTASDKIAKPALISEKPNLCVGSWDRVARSWL